MKNPKYKVGDEVYCYRKESKSWTGFDFNGIITNIANTGTDESPDYEYHITNAPRFFGATCLIWEDEIKRLAGNWYYKPEALEEIEPPEPSIEENPQYKEDKLKFLSLLQTKKIKTRHEEYIQG
jgi:hypothetical protein